MTAQEELKIALRDIVSPAARAGGFKGTGTTWRRTNDLGDWAIVNVQSSSSSTRESLRCVVNLALAPKPWLDWQQQSLGHLPRSIPENLGLYRQRLHPTGSPERMDVWWEIDGTVSAQAAAEDIVEHLNADGLPFLSRLLDRNAMIEQVREGELGFVRRANGYRGYFARAEAVMLSEHGPSDELEALLIVAVDDAMPAQRESAEAFAEWVRMRAANLS
jgi:hypothetical protein